VEARSRTPPWLWLAGRAFIAAIAAILVASIRRPEPPVFALSRLVARAPATGIVGPDTVTIDARSEDRWTFIDLEGRRITTDSAAWDIAVKRHRLAVNGGDDFLGGAGAIRLEGPFERVLAAPAEGYQASRVTGGGDTVSATLDDWYAYSFFSHLLEPEPGVTFVLRTAEGNYAKLRVLSYYCPGPEPGCMTLEYVLRPGGGRGLTPEGQAGAE
jgi:hypothetical protein